MPAPKTMHPAFYRTYQFFAALQAYLPTWAGGECGQLTSSDKAFITSILTTTAQQQLFMRMSPNDRRHALAVARALQQAGYHQPALLQAALLHDVGKSRGQPLLHRVLIVLLKAFWPAGWHRVAAPPLPATHERGLWAWWRRPFVIHAQHPAIGATWAQEAACEPLAITLIARHQDQLSKEPNSVEERLLAVLQWADDLN